MAAEPRLAEAAGNGWLSRSSPAPRLYPPPIASPCRRNIELKARDADPAGSLAACRSIGAEDRGTLLQRDTYFEVPHGRLKLREQEGEKPQLIAYQRADRAEARESGYRIVELIDPEATKAALAAALGVRVVVAKRRQLFLWRSVRIHVDQVDGLGRFIEIEAVASADSDLSHEQRLLEKLRLDLAIEDVDLLAGSYSDLLLAQGGSMIDGPGSLRRGPNGPRSST